MANAAKSKTAAKAKVIASSNVAATAKMPSAPAARIFAVTTHFQKMAKRPGGVPREQAIEQAQILIDDIKSHFDGWLDAELKEFKRLMKKVNGSGPGADWIETANFRSRQLHDSAAMFGFDLLAFIAGSLCEILDSIEAGSECNRESIHCHIESLLLAGQVSYRRLSRDQVPDLTEGLHRVVKHVTAPPAMRLEHDFVGANSHVEG